MSTKFSVSTHKAFNAIEEWLEENPTHGIKLIDLETQKPISWLVSNRRKSVFTSEDISEKYTSIVELFNKLYEIEHTNIVVQFRRLNGNSTITIGKPFKITLQEETTMLSRSGADNGAENSLLPAPVHSQHQPSYQPHNYYPNTQNPNIAFGGLGMAAQQAGLGVIELIDLKTTQKLYDSLKTEHEELKISSKRDKTNLEGKIERLEIDKRALESENKTKDQEMALALKSLGLDQKTFFETDAGAELTSGVMGIAKQLAGGSNSSLAPTGLNAASNVSDAKKQLIDYIVSKEVTDETASNFMSFVVYHMQHTPAFSDELEVLISKHQTS